MSEKRKLSRFLLRRGDRKNLDQVYIDSRGNEFSFKWVAMLASFGNFFSACLLNGFPVVVNRLWYSAWAFYPFFFVHSGISGVDVLSVLNHERVHIRQQREIHIVFSLPLIVMSFWIPWLLWITPFTPTILYMLDLVRVYFQYYIRRPNWHIIELNALRSLTCFEYEANSCAHNMDYLLNRRFFAFLNYM